MPHSFPNLPYLIDGDFTLTETAAIMKYISHKWKPELLGATSAEFATAEMLQFHITVLKGLATAPCYSSPDGNREVILKNIWPVLNTIVKFMDEKEWLVGNKLTWIDFYFWELVDYINFIAQGKLFERYPTLGPYHKRFLELPGLADAWKDDEKLMKYPYNNGHAAIGGIYSKF